MLHIHMQPQSNVPCCTGEVESPMSAHATVNVQELHAFIAADVKLNDPCQLLTWVFQLHMCNNESMQLLNVNSGMPILGRGIIATWWIMLRKEKTTPFSISLMRSQV